MDILGPDDNVLCCTIMGSTPLREFIEAAGAAGFSAVSIAAHDYKNARMSGLSDVDVGALLAQNGLKVAELECIFDWIKPLPDAQGIGFSLDLPIFGHSQDEFFAMADAVGARSVTVADPFPSEEPLDRMVEAFADVCNRAAQHGLRVNLEFISWPPVPNLATGWDIVRLANCPNGGLTLDTTHLMRSGSREFLNSVPGDKIFTTQFADGPIPRIGDAFFDAANRMMPCEGDFDLPSILHEIRGMGCTAPLGFEVINPKISALSPKDIARVAMEGLKRLRAEAAAIQ